MRQVLFWILLAFCTGSLKAEAVQIVGNERSSSSLLMEDSCKNQKNVAKELSCTLGQAASVGSASVVTIRAKWPYVKEKFRIFTRRFFLIGAGIIHPNVLSTQEDKGWVRGAGFVVDERGFIVTSRHVVQRAERIEVTFPGAETYVAKLVGIDPRLDIAVLRIFPKEDVSLVAAKLGSSKSLFVGELVLSIGNPFGLERTVSTGMVSATGRKLGIFFEYHDLIQIDTSLFPGHSGGPVINLDGEVVGISTMVLETKVHSSEIAFATPIDLVRPTISQLVQHGKLNRSSLGIGISQKELRQEASKNKSGVFISHLVPLGPAEKAGLLEQDTIISIEGHSIGDAFDMAKKIWSYPVGTPLTLGVVRQGQRLFFMVTTEELQENLLADETKTIFYE